MNGHDEGNNQQETPVAGIISITLIASGIANSTIIIDDDGAAFFFTPFIIVRWLLKFCTASVMKCNTGDVEVSRHAHDFTFLRTIFLASGNAHPFLLFVYTPEPQRSCVWLSPVCAKVASRPNTYAQKKATPTGASRACEPHRN